MSDYPGSHWPPPLSFLSAPRRRHAIGDPLWASDLRRDASASRRTAKSASGPLLSR